MSLNAHALLLFVVVAVRKDATSVDVSPSFEEIPDHTLHPFPFDTCRMSPASEGRSARERLGKD